MYKLLPLLLLAGCATQPVDLEAVGAMGMQAAPVNGVAVACVSVKTLLTDVLAIQLIADSDSVASANVSVKDCNLTLKATNAKPD
jgi:hypothetical protein